MNQAAVIDSLGKHLNTSCAQAESVHRNEATPLTSSCPSCRRLCWPIRPVTSSTPTLKSRPWSRSLLSEFQQVAGHPHTNLDA